MSKWRNIWKKSIETCQKAVMNRKVEEEFSKLRNTVADDNTKPYENDRMVDFEEGIAYECIGEIDKAIDIYTKVSSPDGLPVKHWRERAEFCLNRANAKKNGKRYADFFKDNFVTEDFSSESTLEKIQWEAFYELHIFTYIPSYIKYLAISSMSRIDSEPEMAIVIFRTCLEDIVRVLYPTEYEENENNRKTLGPLLVNLFNSGILFSKGNNTDFKKDVCKIIKDRGDDAAHGNDIDYSPKYISETILYFIEILEKAEHEIWINKTNVRK